MAPRRASRIATRLPRSRPGGRRPGRTPSSSRSPRSPVAPSTTASRCSRTRPAASTWATCGSTRSAICSPATSGCGASTCCTRWAGTPSGCPPRTRPSTTGCTPRCGRTRTSRTCAAQLRRMGISYDWDREVATCDPAYYKWEQLVFIRMFERGLAYRRARRVNWCPSCQTVLANEQVEAGRCWRCDSEVTIQARSTAGSSRSPTTPRSCSTGATGCPAGRSGCSPCSATGSAAARAPSSTCRWRDGRIVRIPIFTTRPDTSFGMTYAVLAPEHPLVDSLVGRRGGAPPDRRLPRRGRARDRDRAARHRPAEAWPPPAGRAATNPFNRQEIPLFLADYVLMGYGTGAIMAVPGEDQRDWDFAKAARPADRRHREAARGLEGRRRPTPVTA